MAESIPTFLTLVPISTHYKWLLHSTFNVSLNVDTCLKQQMNSAPTDVMAQCSPRDIFAHHYPKSTNCESAHSST